MQEILMKKIKPNPHQPRKYFPKEAQKVLRETLKKQILPILVIAGTMPDIPGDIAIKKDEYLIIDGERRWRASKELGRKTMICEVLPTSYVEAYDNAGIIHRTTATHDPQARARLIVESILNHLGSELEKNWSRDEKGVMSCALYLLHTERGDFKDSKKVGKEFFSKFSEICRRHGWTASSASQRLPKDLHIPEDLLGVISVGTMAHTAVTEFMKVKDEKIRKKIIKKIETKPMAFLEAQKTASILADEEAPQEIKEKILDVEQNVDIDRERKKVQAIKEVKKEDIFTEGEKRDIEKQIIEIDFEDPTNIVQRKRVEKKKEPSVFDKPSPDEFALDTAELLGDMVGNFQKIEKVWNHVSTSQRNGLKIHIDALVKIWEKLNLMKGGKQQIGNSQIIDVEND